jgi:hypothetical protein
VRSSVLDHFASISFLLASILIAIKWHDDEYYKNEYYAKVGGISVADINLLEMEFLNLIGFKLFVDAYVFTNYTNKILQYLSA